MDRYRSSKKKLALLRKNLAERERKLKEFQDAQQRKAMVKKMLLSVMVSALLVVVYCTY